MKKILTDYVFPPIPIRQFDWCAWEEDNEENRAYGVTEQEAITSLLEQTHETF